MYNIYMCVSMCVCVCVYIYVCVCVRCNGFSSHEKKTLTRVQILVEAGCISHGTKTPTKVCILRWVDSRADWTGNRFTRRKILNSNLLKSTKKKLYIYIWGATLQMSVLDMRLNDLMVSFQWCWSFRECGEPLHCHCSLVHSGPEW